MTELREEKGCLTKFYDHIVPAAKAVLQVPELTLLVKILKNIIAVENPDPTGCHDTYVIRPADKAFTAFELPKTPKGADPLDVDVDSLPEDNSMRRGVKEQM